MRPRTGKFRAWFLYLPETDDSIFLSRLVKHFHIIGLFVAQGLLLITQDTEMLAALGRGRHDRVDVSVTLLVSFLIKQIRSVTYTLHSRSRLVGSQVFSKLHERLCMCIMSEGPEFSPEAASRLS